jgi:S-adenosylmethionine-dependent methyltransferase
VPDDLTRTRRWSLRSDPRTAVQTAVVWDVLDALAIERSTALGRPLDVVDVGGGTGGFAVPLAGLGHRVIVVDPSPDALAALQRRASEAGLADRVQPLQGDAGELVGLVGAASADLVLCHGVLEYTDDPSSALTDAVATLRNEGLLSLLVLQRLGAVLARALAGRFDQARHVLDDPRGRIGPSDPVPRRFDRGAVLDLLTGHAMQIRAVHGVRLFADLLPGALVDGDPDAAAALLDLERIAGDHTALPELAAIAAQLHVVAQR